MKYNLLLSVTTLFVLVVGSQIGNAEVKTMAKVPALSASSAVESIKARDTSSLRCWQFGELLFEETHLTEKISLSGDDAVVFKAGSQELGTLDSVRELHLISTGTATCLYEKI